MRVAPHHLMHLPAAGAARVTNTNDPRQNHRRRHLQHASESLAMAGLIGIAGG